MRGTARFKVIMEQVKLANWNYWFVKTVVCSYLSAEQETPIIGMKGEGVGRQEGMRWGRGGMRLWGVRGSVGVTMLRVGNVGGGGMQER